MQNLFSKYQSLTTYQQVGTAIVLFILSLLILPNVIVYAVSIYASYNLINKVLLKRIFVSIFSVATFFSFILLFAEETPEPVNTSSTGIEEQVLDTEAEPVFEVSSTTASPTPKQVSQNEEVNQSIETDTAGTPKQEITSDEGELIEPEEASSDTSANKYKVVRVVDGDTIKLDMNGTTETLRLIGIDTPETVHPSKPVECMGLEASNKAKQLLSGQTIRFESDSTQDTRDRYGRLLGYVFLSNGTNFGEVMIRSGYANEYTYSNAYKYQAAFKAAEQRARANKVGLWADGVCVEETAREEPAPAPAPQPIAAPASDGQKWYVSSHYSSKFYYCEDSDAWKQLSPKYLEVYDSEAALKARYSSHTLHESCQ